MSACFVGMAGYITALLFVPVKLEEWLIDRLQEHRAGCEGFVHFTEMRNPPAKRGTKTARVALAHKLLVIAWHLVKNKKRFDESYLGNSGDVKR